MDGINISPSEDSMDAPYLKPLIPFPIHIDENELFGELDFQYNWEYNHMVIFFRFAKKEHKPAPLKVYVEISGKRYTHELRVIDFHNREARTPIFCPEYRVCNGITFCGIEAFVSRKEKPML